MTAPETLTTVLAEIRSVKAMVINQGKTLKQHASQLHDLEEINQLTLIKKQAVDDYVAAQRRDAKNQAEAAYARTKLKLLRDLSPFIVAAVAVAYAILSRRK